jgi:TolB-like protein/Flp pilus assembly protein TadD
VLPFENLGRPEDAYFADGMADEVRGKLAALPGLEVIARSSSMQYRQHGRPAPEVARELGVRYLLAGTVRYEPGTGGAPGRVRISPELVEIRAGAAVTRWQQPFDAALTGVFAVQADVAERVTVALDVALGTRERAQLARRPTSNLAAYQAFLRGEAARTAGHANGSVIETLPALDAFRRAVTLDSTFGRAWVRLAQTEAVLLGNLPREATRAGVTPVSARYAAEQASRLADRPAEGSLVLGTYYALVLNDMPNALTNIQLGLRIAPDDAELLEVAGFAERELGRYADAVGHLRRAVILDPRAGLTTFELGRTLLWVRRYTDAREAFGRARVLMPTSPNVPLHLAQVELAQGDLTRARAVLRSAAAGVPLEALVTTIGSTGGWEDLAWLLEPAEQDLLPALGSQTAEDRVSWALSLARVYLLRADSARARAYADSARLAAEAVLRSAPDHAPIVAQHGIALAYLGRRDTALREGGRAVALRPLSLDAQWGAYVQHQLVHIYILLGEYEKALETLEPLLTIPHFLSPGWLRVDPMFVPLRGHPRFERLATGRA